MSGPDTGLWANGLGVASAAPPVLCRLRAGPGARARLLCIPHAGGAPSAFRPWAELLPDDLDLWAVQAPGRGARIAEAPHERIEPLVNELLQALARQPDVPTAVFGHSMGALVGFELARALRRGGRPLPVQLFVAGHRAPQLPSSQPPTGDLLDAEFLERLRDLGGTPDEALQRPDLMDVFLPTLRADFRAVESYAYRDEPPLACPITAFGGHDDAFVGPDELRAWRVQTLRRFTVELTRGGHFFLKHAAPGLLAVVARDIGDQLTG